MVDVSRARSGWLVRQLVLQIPPFAVGLVATLSLALQDSLPGWLKAASLSVAIPLLAVLGYFLVQTFWCFHLQRRGRTAEARLQRRLLTSTRGIFIFAMSVLLALISLPILIVPAGRPREAVFHRPAPVFTNPAAAKVTTVEVASAVVKPWVSRPAAPTPVPPEPEETTSDPVPDPPDEVASGFEGVAGGTFPPAGSSAGPSGAERDFFPFAAEFLQSEPAEGAGPVPRGFERLGLPGEDLAGIGPPPELEVDMLFLAQGDDMAGFGMLTSLDYSLGESAGLRVGYFSARAVDGEPFEGGAVLKMRDVQVSYVHRLTGYTRHADLDLAVHAGLVVHVVDIGYHGIGRSERVAPRLGVDLGVWNTESCGILVRAEQSIPVDLGHGSTAVSGLGVLFRADLSETASFLVGWQARYIHLRADPDLVAAGEGDWSRLLTGPRLGLVVRF